MTPEGHGQEEKIILKPGEDNPLKFSQTGKVDKIKMKEKIKNYPRRVKLNLQNIEYKLNSCGQYHVNYE